MRVNVFLLGLSTLNAASSLVSGAKQATVSLLGAKIAAGAYTADDTLYVQQPPIFVHEHSRDFQCPQLSHYKTDNYVRRVVLTKQVKPPLIVPITDALFNSTTTEHVIQLCYNHGTLDESQEIDITLVAMGTVDRLANVPMHAQNWDGLIHYAFYVHGPDDVQKIDQMLIKNRHIRERATIHLVFAQPGTGFPFNLLRNVAQIGVQTSHMFLNDIDFVPLIGTRNEVLKHEKILREQQSGDLRALLVVPACQLDGKVSEEVAQIWEDRYHKSDISDLKKMFESRTLKPFGYFCADCHHPTDYSTWLTATEPYSLPGPSWNGSIPEKYEPYIIVPTFIMEKSSSTRIHFPLFDEIFADFGRDKIIHMKVLRQGFGYKFIVLPKVALYHRRHPVTSMSLNWRKNQEYRIQRTAQYAKRVLWWQSLLNPDVEPCLELWDESRNQVLMQKENSPLSQIPTINRWSTGDATLVNWLSRQSFPDLFPLVPPLLTHERKTPIDITLNVSWMNYYWYMIEVLVVSVVLLFLTKKSKVFR